MTPPRQGTGVRLVVIDDDSGLVTVLDRRFAAHGWERSVFGYAVAPEELAALHLHAALVNPVVTGLRYVETLADGLPGLAVLVLSPAASVADRVHGLRAGADDWITKPCHPDELLARVEAVLRRRRTGEWRGWAGGDETIAAGELSIRGDRFDAYAEDRAAGLSRKEYELLRQLAGADGRVLEREEIYQRVWGYTMARGDRSVDVFVRKLRHKLEAISPGWRYVHTHFGVGYRFAAEPNEVAPGSAPVDGPGGASAAAGAGGAGGAAPAASAAPAAGGAASAAPAAGGAAPVAAGADGAAPAAGAATHATDARPRRGRRTLLV